MESDDERRAVALGMVLREVWNVITSSSLI